MVGGVCCMSLSDIDIDAAYTSLGSSVTLGHSHVSSTDLSLSATLTPMDSSLMSSRW